MLKEFIEPLKPADVSGVLADISEEIKARNEIKIKTINFFIQLDMLFVVVLQSIDR